uniref:Uncharacterized protein n=1 Tax=Anguilla anguilla TaxID=7936 RepID=A0A0E9SBF2_ANGAN
MIHSGAAESRATRCGKIRYYQSSPVFSLISNRFENFYIGPTLHGVHCVLLCFILQYFCISPLDFAQLWSRGF